MISPLNRTQGTPASAAANYDSVVYLTELYEDDINCVLQSTNKRMLGITQYKMEKQRAKAGDISRMEKTLYNKLNELVSLKDVDEETHQNFIIPYVEALNKVLERSKSICQTIDDVAIVSGIEGDGNESTPSTKGGQKEGLGGMGASTPLRTVKLTAQLSIVYEKTMSGNNLDLVPGWRSTFITVNGKSAKEPMLVLNLMFVINTMAKYAPQKWAHIYEYASAVFICDLDGEEEKETCAMLTFDEFINRLSATPLNCVKGLMCDIVSVTKRLVKLEQDIKLVSDEAEMELAQGGNAINVLKARIALTNRTNQAIALARTGATGVATSHGRGFPDLFLSSGAEESPRTESMSLLSAEGTSERETFQNLLSSLKADVALRRTIQHAAINEASMRLDKALLQNKRTDEALKSSCQDTYGEAQKKMEEKYVNDIKTFQGKKERVANDMERLLEGMDKDIEKEFKEEFETKAFAVQGEIVDIEQSTKLLEDRVSEKRTEVMELEKKLHDHYNALKTELENKQKLDTDRDLQRAILLEMWALKHTEPNEQYQFLRLVTASRQPEKSRVRLLESLWTNHAEKLNALNAPYAPSSARKGARKSSPQRQVTLRGIQGGVMYTGRSSNVYRKGAKRVRRNTQF